MSVANDGAHQDVTGHDSTIVSKVFEAWPETATMKVDSVVSQRTRLDSSVSEPEPYHSRSESLVSEPEPVSEPDRNEEPEVKSQEAPATTLAKQLPSIARNARFRKSCYFESTLRAGVLDWCSYNHMLLPCRYDWYQGPNEEYEHLKKHVCIWDVAAERQVELTGPDAVTLVELLTPRPMGDMKIGQCRYAIITDEEGMVLNDPVVSRLAEDRFWLSGADNDLILWAKGLAVGSKLRVRVSEAAVSPVAIQGPQSTALLAELFGDWVYDLKYFFFREVELDGMPIALARSGWSPEVGYELYLQDESRGDDLWKRLWDAGQKYNIKPGTPNQKRRIEGGMLNFGSDITPEHNIVELGLPPSWMGAPGKCKEADFIGKEALQRVHQEGGAQRRVVGIEISGKQDCPPLEKFWSIRTDTSDKSAAIGNMTSLTFSPNLDAWIGIATVASSAAAPGTELCVDVPSGAREAVVRKLPFLPRVPMLPRPEVACA